MVKRVLLTGGAGMLGSAVVETFCDLGDELLVTDVRVDALARVRNGIATAPVDVRDVDQVRSAAVSFRADVIVHPWEAALEEYVTTRF